MALNFNVSPYYDDFDPNKNYHRILFKPGYAVQARELTQSQTILQNQISTFADHIFQKNTPVSGAKITYNTNCNYLKLNASFDGSAIDVSDFQDLIIQNLTGDVKARVLKAVFASGADPDTLIISYLSGGQFTDDQVIRAESNSNLRARTIISSATGQSSVASVSEGVFYVVNGSQISQTTNSRYSVGHFVKVLPQTAVLSKYDSFPNVRVGLNISESIYDSGNDISLLDPADGAPNYQAPGADRYKISLDLETRPISLGDDEGFIELMRIENGQIKKQVDGTVYAAIDDYFAKRTYEESGDYIVNDFKLTPTANANSALYDLNIGKGVAYVQGYRLENQFDLKLTTDRARTTTSVVDDTTYAEYGNYVIVNAANGIPMMTNLQSVDLHIVTSNSTNIVSTNVASYSATLAATARIRAAEFDSYGGTSSETVRYNYKIFLTDIESKSLSTNAASSSNTTDVFLFDTGLKFATGASANNAYNGVKISVTTNGITESTTISSYNGVNKSAKLATALSVTPTISSTVVLNFDIKDVESVVVKNGSYVLTANSNISSTGKSATGDAVLYGSDSNPELVYTIGSPFVSTVNSATVLYETAYTFTNVNSASAALNLPNGFRFKSADKENYIIVNSTNNQLANLQAIIVVKDNDQQVTISGGSGTVTIIAKVSAVGSADTSTPKYIKKIKNLVTANTSYVTTGGTAIGGGIFVNVDTTKGQTWYRANAITSITTGQSLYVADVKKIKKIIDTLSSSSIPTDAMLTDSTYDVTSNYILDNGQRDSYYGHASIKLKPGRPGPQGQLLVCFDYYDNDTSAGGDGYFCVDSYVGESYAEIPTYTAKNGNVYPLRDCFDFRPVVKNAQSTFEIDQTNVPSLIPQDNSTIFSDYSYYLARKDKLVLTKDNTFKVIQGTPAVNPIFPVEPDGSLLLANLTLDPYTAYIPGESPAGILPNLSIEKVKHKRWRMQDISNMEVRVNNIEYYTALNALEKNAQSLQVPDVNGLNRFKNGILVDDFSSYSTADTVNVDFNAAIIRREKKLTAAHDVENFQLDEYPSGATYKVNKIGQTKIYSLPYTSMNLASQTLASNVVNLNPFSVAVYDGVMTLNPPMDNWVDNQKQPDLLIVDPDLQIYRESENLNVLQAGDWKVVPGTTTSTTNVDVSRTKRTTTTTTTTQTYASASQTSFVGYYDKLSSTYDINNGYITDISILPYIRPQQVIFRAKNMLINTPVSAWFDGVNVDKYITAPDIIEMNGVKGTFQEDDVLGFVDEYNSFWPIATVASVYTNPSQNTSVRLGVLGNFSSSYPNVLYLQNTANTANGQVTTTGSVISVHRSGQITAVGSYLKDDTPVTPATWTFYRVKQGRYGAFNKKYGIWSDAKGGNQYLTNSANTSAVFNFNVPVAGNYYFKLGGEFHSTKENEVADWSVNIGKSDGTTVKANSVFTGTTYTKTATVSLPQGTANVSFWMNMKGGNALDKDSFFSLAVANTAWDSGDDGSKPSTKSGIVIFSTDNLKSNSTPLNVSTNTAIYGGGTFYTGVKEIKISGVANTSNGFYENSNVKIFSTKVDYNTATGTYTKTPLVFDTKIIKYIGANTTAFLQDAVSISMGYNANLNSDITSTYSIDGVENNYVIATANGKPQTLSTDENGTVCGIFNIPANTFRNGDRIFRVDNRLVSTDPSSATCIAESVFSASGLSTKTQALNFAAGLDSARKVFTRTNYASNVLINTNVITKVTKRDPIAQTFIIEKENFPNGAFLDSIKLFFASKPTGGVAAPVTLSIVGTQNGYPNGETLPHSIVTLTPDKINTSNTPHHLDSTTYTEFKFQAPVYIQAGVLYAFIVQSQSNQYNVYLGAQNAVAIPSSVKNLPTDDDPTSITKIGSSPYVGGLFESQNGITWQVDQSKNLMFTLERCNFSTTSAKLAFSVPYGLPYRKLTGQDIEASYDANNINNLFNVISGVDTKSHAYNITTTDFVPSASRIDYTYNALLNNGTRVGELNVTPGKYGCPTYEDIYLDDGQGERILLANSNSSFLLYTNLSTTSNTVSPIISDDGLTLFNVRWRINNMELSNNNITLLSGGTGYNTYPITVTVSAPNDTVNGTQAVANVTVGTAGAITGIYFENPGSGYYTTPTMTITNSTRGGNSNVSFSITGETSPSGGNALARYFTKKVVLTPQNESGDLRVFYTAYRPKGSNIFVYYKILNKNDNQRFEDGNWYLMTNISNSNTFSATRDDLIEFQVAPGINNVANDSISYVSTSSGITYTSFNQFAIKIVMSTNDNTSVPYLTDIRALALPSGTGF